jgi:hypothetical protein
MINRETWPGREELDASGSNAPQGIGSPHIGRLGCLFQTRPHPDGSERCRLASKSTRDVLAVLSGMLRHCRQ